MENLKKNISVLALVLGLTLAITGSAFKPAMEGDLRAKIGGVWEDIPDTYVLGQNYTCESSGTCTALFDPEEVEYTDENAIANSIQPGSYSE